MDKLSLLEKLLKNNNLSKSETRVIFFCFENEKTSKEVGQYLEWQAPNVARLLLTMYNKGFLNRRQLDDNRTYLYTTNKENELLDLKNVD
ncbi:hypothetical protein ACW7DJ_00040 (plasmid) [Mammaliicoccus sciuri]|uniref:hypothetical protein n=1 Tax=Mammaliicoccus TaxID=2803850 RepID=UPI0018CB9B14|nr:MULTISPECIES: hypothetical protein [Mammaliicoccus]MBG9211766.1 hypothetical protein [Mammaliicoccus sciuri]MEB5648614.1 hypothetical protein [Mammaliicoccus sciuri]MEB6259623.1 hypothetical protein [Mammaliicoccus sciuri]MEB8191852.1 hypothetical protein [Mammaliicoccus sciuri]